MKHQLCPINELHAGEIRRVVVDGMGLAVVRTPDDGLFVLRDVCPHYGAQLSGGRVRRTVVERDANYALANEYSIRCPWHAYEFDLTTGSCLSHTRVRVRTYPVSVENGIVTIELNGRSRRGARK